MEDNQLSFDNDMSNNIHGDHFNPFEGITDFNPTGQGEYKVSSTSAPNRTELGHRLESTPCRREAGSRLLESLSSPFFFEGEVPLTGASKLNSASSSPTHSSLPSRVAAESTGQLLSDDEIYHIPFKIDKVSEATMMFNRYAWAEPYNPEPLTKVTFPVLLSELSESLQDEILGRVSDNKFFKFKAISKFRATFCPPILGPRPSSGSEFDPSSFLTTDEEVKLDWSDGVDTSSAERTVLHPPNSFAGNVLPSPDPDLSKDFLVAGGAQGLLCINVGKAAGGSEKLVIYNPAATGEKFKVLPPLFMHPVVMHLRVNDSGDYNVFVAGIRPLVLSIGTIGTEYPSLITKEYSSTTGVWECTEILPCPLFGLNEYQNGVYWTGSERELLVCVGILDMELGTKGVLMYDFKKKQWVQGPIIPLVRSESPNVVSCTATTMHIVGCGGSLFVSSIQECGRDEYFCIHKLNLESSGDNMWEEILLRKKGGGRALLVYPEFTRVPLYSSLLSATVVEESGIMFSELEVGKEVFMCIHKLKPSPDGSGSDSVWEEIWRCKRKRHRAPNWGAVETIAYLKLREEGLGWVVGKIWDFISRGLGERYGFIRGSLECERKWSTLLKSHTEIHEDLQSKNIHPDTSAWVNFWKMHGNERSKNKVFSLECYEMMNRILGIKPRKKAGGNKKQMVDASAPGSSSSQLDNLSYMSSLQGANNPSPSAPSAVGTFAVESFINSQDQGDDQPTKDESPAMTDLTSEVRSLCNFLLEGGQNLSNRQIAKTKEEALKIVKSKLQLEFLKEKNKARDCANRRPKKSRKLNA